VPPPATARVVAFAAIVLACSSCARQGPSGRVTGSVMYRENDPQPPSHPIVPGVAVVEIAGKSAATYFSTFSTRSTSAGYFTMKVPPGMYSVSAHEPPRRSESTCHATPKTLDVSSKSIARVRMLCDYVIAGG
jgi:hypothetical protein